MMLTAVTSHMSANIAAIPLLWLPPLALYLLHLALAQNLFKRVDKKGRVAALEILVFTTAIANLVREGKSRQLRNTMISGQQEGMQTIEMDLARLVASGIISFDTAAEISAYPKEIMTLAATAKSQQQAAATLASGQGGTTGSGQLVGAR